MQQTVDCALPRADAVGCFVTPTRATTTAGNDRAWPARRVLTDLVLLQGRTTAWSAWETGGDRTEFSTSAIAVKRYLSWTVTCCCV